MSKVLENVRPDENSSFRLLVNPRLSDLYYWHFHPEIELVYIECEEGPRQIGDHVSRYHKSDLVLIGSNIPHLNFDYGVTTPYHKVVLQIHPGFSELHFQPVPELRHLADLLLRASRVLIFRGETKKTIGQKMKALAEKTRFGQFAEVLDILHYLAQSDEADLLLPSEYRNHYSQRDQDRLRATYAFVEKHYREKIALRDIAGMCHLGEAAFCRFFNRMTGMSFTTFLNQYRVSQAKNLLQQGASVSEAAFDSGYETLSFFHRTFKKITGENPAAYRNKHSG